MKGNQRNIQVYYQEEQDYKNTPKTGVELEWFDKSEGIPLYSGSLSI